MEGWENKSLTDLAKYINGYAFKPDDWGKEGLPIIRIEQLKNPETICDYYEGKIPEHNIIDDGDLIFSWSASLFLKFWIHGEAALNQHLFKVEAHQNVDKCFLKFFIEFYLPEITKMSHGSTMQHITRKELDNFVAYFPVEKWEQEKIATVLSTIDLAIAQTEAIIAKQQRIKTGLMQDLLTKGIDENGTIRSEETHEFKDSPLGRIPVEWEYLKVNDVCSLVTKGTTPKRRDQESSDYPIPFLRVQNLTFDGQIDLFRDKEFISLEVHNRELSRSIVIPGDILQNIVGPPLGKVCIVSSEYSEWNINQAIAIFRPSCKIASNFLYYWMLKNTTQTWFEINSKKTSGQQNLTLENCQNLPIALPIIEEQQRIHSLIGQMSASQLIQQAQLKKLKILKTGLMQDLLTGKVRVTELLKDIDR